MNNIEIDPITLDIVRDSLIAVSNEVFYAFARTSMSPIIYETLDYASGITDSNGNLLTQGNGACGFIGLISPLIRSVIAKHGRDNMKPGDVYIINDPYMGGGSHLSDIGMVMPVFYDDELVAYVGNKAHWTDVGGANAGSFTVDATETFQEGLCFSAVKLMDAGKIIPSMLDIIKSNVRFPDMAEGDMWGQIASLRTGERRLRELCAKYGPRVVKGSMERLLEQGEYMARNRLKDMPKGRWGCVDYMDDDGSGNQVELRVKVSITDEAFIVDFTGSSPQVLSTINTGYTALCAGVKIVYMSIIGSSLEVNDGVFRPLRVIAEEGSVLNCRRPAPTSCYFESLISAADLVWRALADVFPDCLGAGHMLSVCAVVMSGIRHSDGEPFLIVEPTGGGWGASLGKDGEVGQFCVGDGETYNVPVEMAENRYGIIVDEFSLHADGAGAGEYRGGCGCVRSYRALSDGQRFTGIFGRNIFPAWGAAGGKDGSYNYFEFIDANGAVEGPMGIKARRLMNRNDVVRMVTCTGGGYGNPFLRDPRQVAFDVKNEFITIEQAKNDYGVLVDPLDLSVKGFTPERRDFMK